VSLPSHDECSAFGPSASDDAFDVGFSVPHQRTLVSQHAGTRATRLHIARRSVTREWAILEQFSGVLGLIILKLHPPVPVLPRFSDSLAMISQIIIICTNKVVRRGSNLYIFHLYLLSLEWQASGVIAMCGRVHSPTNDSVNHSRSNLGECIRRCLEVALVITALRISNPTQTHLFSMEFLYASVTLHESSRIEWSWGSEFIEYLSDSIRSDWTRLG
jgi:hypothetical protein